MRRRPHRGAFGLRGRIAGAVLVTTVATLTVAAVAVLGPLEHDLRNASLHTLQKQLGKNPAARFEQLRLTDLGVPKKEAATALAIRHAEARLAGRIGNGTFVAIVGYPGVSGRGQALLPPPQFDSDSQLDSLGDTAAAFRTRRPVSSFGSINGTEFARVAIPFKDKTSQPPGLTFVLAVRKPAGEITDAVHVVRTAFIYAALAGLALTLLLAIPLSGTLVRRLRRLSQAALALTHAGAAIEVPPDRTRDEVGDLSRAFTIMHHRLEQQEEARRAFVATASHELRTPLTSLEGMLELLEDDLDEHDPDLDDARALLSRARAQSRRLGRLAADLLDLSRIDAEVQLRSEPVELGELSRAVMAEFELGTLSRGLNPTLDDSTGPVWALGDPGSVARILRILLENAVRVSPDGSVIRVELKNGDRASLSVRDEGPGVAPEEREMIFQRFQRGRETGGQAGFGLGLAIGRELAGRMGGELVLEDSTGPGATFTLRLRAAHAPEGELLPV